MGLLIKQQEVKYYHVIFLKVFPDPKINSLPDAHYWPNFSF